MGKYVGKTKRRKLKNDWPEGINICRYELEAFFRIHIPFILIRNQPKNSFRIRIRKVQASLKQILVINYEYITVLVTVIVQLETSRL